MSENIRNLCKNDSYRSENLYSTFLLCNVIFNNSDNNMNCFHCYYYIAFERITMKNNLTPLPQKLKD